MKAQSTALKIKNNFKAQSAMEYLMTYGWAILAIVIVLGILMFINPMGPPEACIFSAPSLSCANARIVSVDGEGDSNIVYAKLSNNQQEVIQVLGMACVSSPNMPKTDATGNFEHPAFRLDTGGAIPSIAGGGEFLTVKPVAGNGFKLQCLELDESGMPLPKENQRLYSQGENFMGTVYVAYKMRSDPAGFPLKITSAKLSGRVQ